MLFRGKGKGNAPASGSGANEEGRWQGMQEELRSMVCGIAQSFGKSSSGGSKDDPWLNRLSRLHALTFKGRDKPKECKAWLLKTKKILESIACPIENWVWLTFFLLEGDVNQWWRATQCLRFSNSDLLMISYKDFLDAFYEKYFPGHERDRFNREFRGLQQGSMTVVEYEATFSPLSNLLRPSIQKSTELRDF